MDTGVNICSVWHYMMGLISVHFPSQSSGGVENLDFNSLDPPPLHWSLEKFGMEVGLTTTAFLKAWTLGTNLYMVLCMIEEYVQYFTVPTVIYSIRTEYFVSLLELEKSKIINKTFEFFAIVCF